jgi:hypothetical protein
MCNSLAEAESDHSAENYYGDCKEVEDNEHWRLMFAATGPTG